MCCLVPHFTCDFLLTPETIHHHSSLPLHFIGVFTLSEEGPASPLQLELLYISVLVLKSVCFPISWALFQRSSFRWELLSLSLSLLKWGMLISVAVPCWMNCCSFLFWLFTCSDYLTTATGLCRIVPLLHVLFLSFLIITISFATTGF